VNFCFTRKTRKNAIGPNSKIDLRKIWHDYTEPTHLWSALAAEQLILKNQKRRTADTSDIPVLHYFFSYLFQAARPIYRTVKHYKSCTHAHTHTHTINYHYYRDFSIFKMDENEIFNNPHLICINEPNFLEIGHTVAEMSQYSRFFLVKCKKSPNDRA